MHYYMENDPLPQWISVDTEPVGHIKSVANLADDMEILYVVP